MYTYYIYRYRCHNIPLLYMSIIPIKPLDLTTDFWVASMCHPFISLARHYSTAPTWQIRFPRLAMTLINPWFLEVFMK